MASRIASRNVSPSRSPDVNAYDMNKIVCELPEELFRPSYRKAFRALAMSLSILVCGYIALVFSPWFLMPLGWLVIGTATMGLAVVASDCSNKKFVRSQFLNEVVGMLCMVPLWTPFYSWNHQPSRRLARSPFWLLTFTWQWMKANFAPTMSKKLIFNLICVYAFVCLFFPFMTKTVGIWGLFKYYFIPLAVYHVWMSTFLKITDLVEIDNDSILLYSYPQWIELIGTNLNLLMTEFTLRVKGMPSYNSKAAKQTLVSEWSQVTQEVRLGWTNLIGWNTTATPRPINWEEKRTVMQIHGIWYDVTDFKHPGGPVALELGRNRDATALFEAHHVFTSRARLDGLLSKYRISDERAAQLHTIDGHIGKKEYQFDWSLSTKPEPADGVFNDFATEVRSRVKAHFAQKAREQGITLLQATKATWGRWFCMIFWSVCFVVSSVYYVQGSYLAMLVTPVLAWVFAANIAHDALHFSLSTKWWLNSIMGHVCPFTASPLQWYHQHVIGHHAYPNVPFQDPDLAHAPAFMRVHPSVRWRPAHVWQRFTTAAVWTFGATLYMTIVPLKALYLGALNRSVPYNKLSTVRITMHVLGRLSTAVLLWGWQWYVFRGDIARQILFTIVPMLIHSICFMLATQVNHLTEENSQKFSREYYEHQVLTSHSFGQSSDITFWFSGGLNLQIEHHLFPTVNHCHLKELQPIVKELCAKYNIHYHESPTYVSALQKYWQHICSMAEPPKEIDY